MIAVGVDTHKHRHVAVALDAAWPGAGRDRDRGDHGGLPRVGRLAGRAGRRGGGRDRRRRQLRRRPLPASARLPGSAWSRSSGRADAIDAREVGPRSTRCWRPSACSPAMASRRRARPAVAPRCVSCWSAYRSCVEERTRLLNQLQGLHVTAPAALRERIGRGNGARLAERLVRMRDRPGAQLHEQTMLTVLRDLARRARQLDAQAGQLPATRSQLLSASSTQRSWTSPASARSAPPSSWSATRHASETRPRLRAATAPRHSPPHPARPSATGSPAAATAKPTTRSTRSP